MKVVIIIAIILVVLFLLSVIVYWFNLDSKLVKALEKPMNKHYDSMKRDSRL